jgi:hypothetical protein
LFWLYSATKHKSHISIYMSKVGKTDQEFQRYVLARQMLATSFTSEDNYVARGCCDSGRRDYEMRSNTK